MASDQWTPKISAYVDADLPAEDMRALDAHLRECPSCAAETLHQLQLKQATKLAARRYTPSPEFRRKIAGQITAPMPSRLRWIWRPVLAAAAVVIIVSGLWLNHSFEQARSQRLLAELTDLHVANLAASTPVDVVSSDRHTVKPWFQGKLPFTFDLPELAGSSFSLAGGRLTYLDHEPGALLVYNAGAHHISAFIFRDQPELDSIFSARESSSEMLNFHVESWATNGLRYFVVGDANESSIHELTGLLRKGGNG